MALEVLGTNILRKLTQPDNKTEQAGPTSVQNWLARQANVNPERLPFW